MCIPLRDHNGGKEGIFQENGSREGREEEANTKDSESISPSLHPITKERRHGHLDMSAPIQILKRACQVYHFPKQYHFPPTYPLFIRPELVQNNPAGDTVFEQAIIRNDSRGGPSSPSCHFFVHNTPFVSISSLYVSSISFRCAAQDWDRKTKQDNRNELDVFPLFPPW